MKAMKEFGYHKHRHIKASDRILGKIFVELKFATIFAKRFPF